jgi:hypothetical protein
MTGRQESVAGLLEPRRQACPEEEVARRRPLLSKQIEWGSKLDLPDQPDGWSEHHCLPNMTVFPAVQKWQAFVSALVLRPSGSSIDRRRAQLPLRSSLARG